MKNKQKNNFFIPRRRKATPNPMFWNLVLQTHPIVKENYGCVFNVEYNIYKDGFFTTLVHQEDWNRVANYITNKVINDANYFTHLKKATNSAKRKILRFLERQNDKELSNLSFQQIIKEINVIYNLFLEYDSASVFIWYTAGEPLRKNIKDKINIDDDNFTLLTMPKHKTLATQMELDLASCILTKGNEKNLAQKLSNKYYWIPFAYDGPKIWDKDYFLEKIRQGKKKTKEYQNLIIESERGDAEREEKIRKIENQLTDEKKRLINILRTIGDWTDERKMLDFQLFYYYHLLLQELSSRYHISLKLLKHLLIEEITDLDTRLKELKSVAKSRINREFIIGSKKGKLYFVEERKKEYQKIKEILHNQEDDQKLKGVVASRGEKNIYIARACVIHSSSECRKVKNGDILITSMTTPDYVPAMKKALGFITDEGGITCHAAIVAREMNKPCIISTKKASQVIKSGDKIKMNLDSGIIEIVS